MSVAELLAAVHTGLERDFHLDRRHYRLTGTWQEGALRLEGELPDIAAKRRALYHARRVPGVPGVVDELRVPPVAGREDGALRDDVYQWLASENAFMLCDITVFSKGQWGARRSVGAAREGLIRIAVTDRVVRLAGWVVSLSHRRVAEVLCWWTGGCAGVSVTGLEVRPEQRDSDDEMTDALRVVYDKDPMVHSSQIGIRTTAGVVMLGGLVSGREERRRAEFDAWCLGAQQVKNDLEVGPLVASL